LQGQIISQSISQSNLDGGVAPSEQAPTAGGSLKVSLTCPDCKQVGMVEWKNLNRPMRCQCGCRFLIDRDGQLRSFENMAQVHFTCPRCSQTSSFPLSLVGKGACCPGCGLTIAKTPEKPLPAVEEESPPTKFGKRAPRNGSGSSTRAAQRTANRKPLVVLLSACCVAAVVAAFVVKSFFGGSSADAAARAFTESCLAGNWNDAREFIEESDVQRAEFDRFSIRYFASIQNDFRPPGDKVAVEIKPVADGPQERVLQVVLRSTALGERAHPQVWRINSGHWLFDPSVTLRRQDSGALSATASKSQAAD
jgi:hypothetical protein